MIATVFGVATCLLAIVPRASVLLLVFFAIIVVVRDKDRRHIHCGRNVLIISLIVIWPVMSLFWSPDWTADAVNAFKCASLMGVGYVILHYSQHPIAIFSHSLQKGMMIGGAFGVAIVAAAALYAVIYDQALWGSFYFDPLTTLNSNAVVLALFVWPIATIAGDQSFARVIIPVVVVFFGLLLLSSTSALVAVIIGAVAALIRGVLGRSGGIILAILAALFILGAPYIVTVSGIASYKSPHVVNDSTSIIPYSARHRLAMWSFATEKISEKPWLGWGFGASRHIPQEEYRLAPNMEIMPLHPHNLALQTRLELGIPGTLILAVLVFAVFYRLATFTDDGWKSGFAMAPAVGWFFVANVSYGMWQSWWIATAFLLVILVRQAFADPADEDAKTADSPGS